MVLTSKKQAVVSALRRQMLELEGFKQAGASVSAGLGLGKIETVFPGGVFPLNTVHEFVYDQPEELAASCGFIGGLLSYIMKKGGMCLWINSSKEVFPPAAKMFGLEPDRIIFVSMQKQQDTLWALEEGLKCMGLCVVIAEIEHLDFVQSRRLQLAVEKSGVTGFVIRSGIKTLGATTCAARWKIIPIASIIPDDLPGVGFPQWEVNLLKVKNGSPSQWVMGWKKGQFSLQQAERPAGRTNQLITQEAG